jgi:hypothetical protein
MAILSVGIGPSKRREPKASEDPHPWAASSRNAARGLIGTVGGIRSECRARSARNPQLGEQKIPAFTPVMIEPVALPMPSAGRPEAKPKTPRRSSPGQIELEIDGVVVRVGRGAQAKTVAAVIQALKAAR